MAKARSRKPVIRLLSIAAPFKSMLPRLDCANARDLFAMVQAVVGDRYRVTGNAALIEADEDEARAGRSDDAARVREIERTLANDDVVAAVALRGGAWLTRLLGGIDFSHLHRRRGRLAMFGFSEITPLLNITARSSKVAAYYDLCPGFLLPALTSYAKRTEVSTREASCRKWAADRFRLGFEDFFGDVVAVVEGRGSSRSFIARLAVGRLPKRFSMTLVGGNLSTLVTIIGSPQAKALKPDGRWLLLEDVREAPERIDRLLSHLSLSGLLAGFEGILMGDFHDQSGDLSEAVLAILGRHLGRRRVPILISGDIGHTWPIATVPIGRPFDMVSRCDGKGKVEWWPEFPWARWRTV
jgi:muramoyltetrapeptide carboxypeptidase